MRLFFPNTTRPKKAAKHLAEQTGLPLSRAQSAVARACGYRDWHEFEIGLGQNRPSVLDQDLTPEEFVARQARMIIAAAMALSIPDGDVQYALSRARLSGDRRVMLDEQIAIRLAIWRQTVLPPAAPRQRGAIGKLKTPGRNGEVVILRHHGRPTEAVSHQGITTVADFEYVSPRTPQPPFLPMRLYLPYGVWTEATGAKVIFCRDYKPMWRVHANGAVERLEPWLWIKFVKQDFLWGAAGTPWHSKAVRSRAEQFLIDNGLHALPVMADALPLLVHDPSDGDLNFAMGADLLERLRRKEPSGVAA